MIAAAGSFALLELLPIDFSYWAFGSLLLLNGLAMGAFAAPNRAGVMNSLPPEHRGVGSGMNSTFQNSAQVLSIGIFFTLMIVGLAAALPSALYHGLVAQGVPAAAAERAAHLPPVSTLFAAFLGYNPIQHLLGASVFQHLPQATVDRARPAGASSRASLPRRSARGCTRPSTSPWSPASLLPAPRGCEAASTSTPSRAARRWVLPPMGRRWTKQKRLRRRATAGTSPHPPPEPGKRSPARSLHRECVCH